MRRSSRWCRGGRADRRRCRWRSPTRSILTPTATVSTLRRNESKSRKAGEGANRRQSTFVSIREEHGMRALVVLAFSLGLAHAEKPRMVSGALSAPAPSASKPQLIARDYLQQVPDL